MRFLTLLSLALSIAATGCAPEYSLPATLSAPTVPANSLYDGVGDLSVTGSLTTHSLGGRVAVSPAPHLGVHVSGFTTRPRFGSEETTVWTVEQSEAGAGATLCGPAEGTLRTELTGDVASGRVAGFGADAVSTAFCFFCRPELLSDLYRVDARRTRQSGAVTVASDWDAIGLGMTLGVSRATVPEVESDAGGSLSRAVGTVLDNALFVQSCQGAGTIRLWVGGSVPLGENAKADEDGVVRGLGGTYRTAGQPYIGIDLGGLLRAVEPN